MASWLFTIMVIHWGWQLGICSAAGGTESITLLIQKYSDSTGIITIEQMQHILDRIHNCSSDSNNVDTANSVRRNCASNEDCSHMNNTCLSAVDLFRKLNIKDGKLNITSFELACPVILEHLESQVCSREQLGPDNADLKTKPSETEVWGLGFLFVTIISLCSLLGVSVLPLMDKVFYKQLLTALIGLAVGSLAASSLFHLIPQAFGLMNSDIYHHYLNRSLMMWAGIWVFFMTERIMKMITDNRQKNGRPSACQYPTNELSVEVVSSISSPTELVPHIHHELEPLQVHECSEQHVRQEANCLQTNPGIIYDYQEQAIKASFGHQEKPRLSHAHGHEHLMHFEQGKDSAIATVAWMVVFGDGLHNFIDGLSIGAAFNESLLTGISISVAVMCEEFPHELGDFAVLLNAGMTMKQALIYNFLSACTCYIGLVFGIMLGEIEASSYIFGFAAGMFMYISLVDMVPEMNEVAEEASKVSLKKAFQTLLLQNIGMGIGVLALYILARYQDSINFG
ncbi:Zinc transporter ZIP14 [Cryptotermes secundus]|nr:zinc transporter ZIP14 isoform X2 [Cryptotermes secundus]XP_023718618.1 zinc transporter ZIP14 isoform X2 [Cryptotermes secundus]XP_023718619.1 zinc transporter ZIP14 isoform X2 [Cryptotermes secundus]XP_033609758.1 zinc transporter ZIP14 isoform X2 [Cryptotermes secundus]XP_033609759.1 zinc transporter ZIP14 isoform X2 [Cryptotermes secundus]PNF22333.1 Zinc transporter ZIP14 [Cryptotermes secundus]PNF22334.1 Zinc transporter ZIP14 [Cryptotermes secundus]PNF22335.1 Zinc transporter ZIP14 